MRAMNNFSSLNAAPFLLLIALGGTEAATAQLIAPTAPSALTQVKASWPEINLNVVVLDKSEDPLEEVPGANFHLFEDGSERPIKSLAALDSPVSIVFIIDTSGSTYMRRGLYTEVVRRVANALPAGSEVMVTQFDDQVKLVLPFTPASSADLSFLYILDSRGRSVMFDAVVTSEQYFSEHAHFAKRALVLLSDGGEDASLSQEDSVLRYLQWPGSPEPYMFVIRSISSDDEGRNVRTMKRLATEGGGVTFIERKPSDIVTLATRLSAAIRCQQVLSFTSADPARNGKNHKIELRLPDKNLKIHVLPEYFAPAK